MGFFNFSPTPSSQPVPPPILKSLETTENVKLISEFAEKWKSLKWNLSNRESSTAKTYRPLLEALLKEMDGHHITEADCENYFKEKVKELH